MCGVLGCVHYKGTRDRTAVVRASVSNGFPDVTRREITSPNIFSKRSSLRGLSYLFAEDSSDEYPTMYNVLFGKDSWGSLSRVIVNRRRHAHQIEDSSDCACFTRRPRARANDRRD